MMITFTPGVLLYGQTTNRRRLTAAVEHLGTLAFVGRCGLGRRQTVGRKAVCWLRGWCGAETTSDHVCAAWPPGFTQLSFTLACVKHMRRPHHRQEMHTHGPRGRHSKAALMLFTAWKRIACATQCAAAASLLANGKPQLLATSIVFVLLTKRLWVKPHWPPPRPSLPTAIAPACAECAWLISPCPTRVCKEHTRAPAHTNKSHGEQGVTSGAPAPPPQASRCAPDHASMATEARAAAHCVTTSIAATKSAQHCCCACGARAHHKHTTPAATRLPCRPT
jgi:hypothetical protein